MGAGFSLRRQEEVSNRMPKSFTSPIEPCDESDLLQYGGSAMLTFVDIFEIASILENSFNFGDLCEFEGNIRQHF